MIPTVIERCVGIDVGKKFIAVCVMTGPANGEPRSEIRSFGTTVGELKQARAWIADERCTDVVMESTGTYWKPVFNILEGHVKVALANPHEVKARKGHKTDPKDSWWLAHLLRHGMVTPSFIPPRPQRELRDLTRRRRKMIQNATAEKNRVGKVLEDANIKLGSVLSDVFGVSGQLMLEALLEGKADAAQMAQLAKARAKKKIPAIIAALQEHRMSEHHRRMIRFSLEHMQFLVEQLVEIENLIRQKIQEAGYEKQWELLRTLPAVKENAAAILAEMGPNPDQFPDEKHLGSWSGLCPGNNRSAGRNKSSHTNQGNKWLRAALTESAWGVSRMKDGHLRDKFWRIAAKGDPKRSRPIAVVAIAHDLLKLAYFVLQRGTPYEESRGNPMTEQQRQRLIQHHIRRLGKLGIPVRLSLPPAPRIPRAPRVARVKCKRKGGTAKASP
jgi:transposase